MKSLLVVLALTTFSIYASSGHGQEGGNGIGILFRAKVGKAIEVVSRIKKSNIPEYYLINDLDLDKLKSTAKRMKIIIVDDALTVDIDGEEVEVPALSNPTKQLTKVNGERFLENKDFLTRDSLAFHELLILAGYETTGDYQISQFYYNYIAKQDSASYHCKSSQNKLFEGRFRRDFRVANFTEDGVDWHEVMTLGAKNSSSVEFEGQAATKFYMRGHGLLFHKGAPRGHETEGIIYGENKIAAEITFKYKVGKRRNKKIITHELRCFKWTNK